MIFSRRFMLAALALAACGTPTEDGLETEVSACDVLPARSGVDLDDGCVDGTCLGMTVAEATVQMGPPEWSNGASHHWGYVAVHAANGNGKITSITLEAPFDGGTESGLGIDVAMECFVEVLRSPAHHTSDDSGDYIRFPDLGVMVGDVDGGYYDLDSSIDGKADIIIISEL
jgi:hypothetical protein